MSEGNTRVRLSIVGVIVIAMFSGLLARLWFLQVVNSQQSVAQTTANRTRIVTEPAVRGTILDRTGKPIVENKLIDTIEVSRNITPEERAVVVPRLATVLKQKAKDIDDKLDSPRYSPYQPVPIAQDVSYGQIVYLKEHPELFPSVKVVRRSVRLYPNGSMAAHLLGYVGSVNATEQKLHKGQHYGVDDVIGKGGVEQIFESELRGKPRVQKLEVDSRGRLVRVLSDTPSQAGNDIQVTMDLAIQKVAEDSLAQGILGARALRDESIKDRFATFRATGGAAVVLDARDGSIVALASYPTFDITKFTSGIPADELQVLTDPSSNNPLLDRASQGTYAPGSTFKLFTAIAALQYGVTTPDEPYEDRGYIEVGAGAGAQRFYNAGKVPHGIVTMPRALAVSSDVYFDTLAFRFWANYFDKGDKAKGNGIQTVARQYGLGRSTGSGLSNEAIGRIPDETFKQLFNKDNPERQSRIWLPGDTMNLSIGQGDVLTTPLQMASAYAAFANGGTLYTPKLVKQILSPGSEKPLRDLPNLSKKISLKPEVRAPIMEGLKGALIGDGTAALAFSGFTGPAAGKTGTSQVNGKQDSSIFVGVFNPDPAPDKPDAPQYVVAVFVEQGGFGSSVAAPIGHRIMLTLNGEPNPAPVHVIPTKSND